MQGAKLLQLLAARSTAFGCLSTQMRDDGTVAKIKKTDRILPHNNEIPIPSWTFTVLQLALVSLSSGACYHSASSLHINLQGFSKRNYDELKQGLGREVCITGHLSIDSMGVYYALQPIQGDGVIDIGFSRINTGLSRRAALQTGLVNGRVHTLCGSLNEATPFEGCEADDCKWYALRDAGPLNEPIRRKRR